MLKTTKIRLYPNKSQKLLLSQQFGNSRFVYNLFLSQAKEKKDFNTFKYINLLPDLKKELEFLKLSYSACLQQSVCNLSKAFKNFFDKRSGFPKFKSRNSKQSLSFPQNIKLEQGFVKVPKLGLIKAKIHREITGKIKTCHLTKNSCDQYFISILTELPDSEPEQLTELVAVGIDLGIKDLAVLSNGEKIKNNRHLRKHEKNLKRKQKALSRKKLKSANRAKARKKLAKIHNKIANCRSDYLHKQSRRIVDESQIICVEDLNIKGMVKNHKLAKSIHDCSWGKFKQYLEYKSKFFIKVNRFFPSSKQCNCCGNKTKLSLSDRFWKCEVCKAEHDRDINAAINIVREGIKQVNIPQELGISLL